MTLSSPRFLRDQWSQLAIRLCAHVLLMVSPAVVFAEDQASEIWLEEVVVTAEFRPGAVQQLPASISVIAPDDAGTTVQHLEEVLNRAPNVNLSSGGARAKYIQMRGIGERGQFADPLNSSVGLVIDGVDLSGVGAAATLFDVAQVEVLRGPQGTLYGANALAGLINVVTKQPTPDHTAQIRLDVGDYSSFGVGGVLAGPVGMHGGYRVSLQQYQDDGFMKNRYLNKETTNGRDEASYRAKYVWQKDALKWDVTVGYTDIDNGFDALSLDNNRTTYSDQPGQDKQETAYIAVNLSADLSERVAFAGSVSHADSEIDYGYDEDWTFDGFDPIGYSSTDRYRRERETQTLDFRWLSRPGEGFVDGIWDWVVGVYGFRQDVDLRRDYTYLSSPFDSRFSIDRLAVYGELSRSLGASQSWQLTFGARLEQFESDYQDSAQVQFSPKDNLFGGRVLLEKHLDDNSLAYIGVTQGYKSGGFNTDGSLDTDLREFDPETLWNIELGYKARFMDERVELRGALFRMQRRDIQISTSTVRPIPGSEAVQFISYTGNAADGFNQGLELEFTFDLSDRATMFANLGLLDTQYSDYVDNSGRDLDGREQAHAPSYQFFAGLSYQLQQRWQLRLELEGKDAFYFSSSHAEQSSAYELINASLTYQHDAWSARLWGRNLTDEDVFVRGFFFGNDPRDFYTDRVFTQLGEPRQIGLTLQVDW